MTERGWAVVPLLDGDEVARLRVAYGREHGWDGTGFEPDPGNPDFEYRARVARVVSEVVDRHIERCFDRFIPFLRGYYCKWPGEGSTALHWDWSCVDEREGHRAYQVWIALQDVDDYGGGMAVLSRSHLVDLRPRGTDLSIPLSPEMDRRADELGRSVVRVPLRAGEALVFDMGLVHVSSPNRATIPRLAAVTSLRPAEAGLVYFRGIGAGMALRFDVDEHWYNHMVPMELHSRLPDLMASEVLDVTADPGMDERILRLAGAAQADDAD